ncbi:Mdy2p Ecym_3530 [Eremothecium cymbalariae DBVPG|uniref:Ubiquitin-like domain-containing protein n=1 Tax=Eremothecium cymbalariae (strain CBS 270.75 / DBVPG 7215 / KCTC 17166 / NRRL Y-17582) TaxID=931890 RepID=G8JQM3_ERECY|nr:Hypothetical protein Ecym_3530 [Eremothecium cymbalariae DBVPG\
MTTAERDFVTRFLTLTSINEPALSKDYFKPLEEIQELGLSLKPLNYKYDHKRVKLAESQQPNDIEITIKSIKPPKFNHTKVFKPNNTVLEVKAFLKSIEKGVSEDVEIKLLLKGKVLHDSLLLSDLKAAKVLLTAMIAKAKAPSAVPKTKSDSEPVVVEAADFEVGVPWDKIHDVLAGVFKDDLTTSTTLDRLRRGWELAK